MCEICHGPFSANFRDPPVAPPQRAAIPLGSLLLAMPHLRALAEQPVRA